MSDITDKYIKVTENVFTTPATKKEFRNDLRPAHTSMMTCIALPRELVFIDCGMNKKFATQFREDMENHFNRKTSYLILDHMHDDHYMAMEVFKDVEVIAPKIGVESFEIDLKTPDEEYEHQIMETAKLYSDDKDIEDTVKNAALFVPQKLVEEQLTIGPEGNELVMRVVGGHSKDSMYVYFENGGVLCAGDNIVTCYAQYIFDPKIIETFKYWESLPIEHVIAGHGSVVSKDYIKNVRQYFEELFEKLKEFKKENLTVDEVIKHPDLPIYFATKEDFWDSNLKEHNGWLEYIAKYWYEKHF